MSISPRFLTGGGLPECSPLFCLWARPNPTHHAVAESVRHSSWFFSLYFLSDSLLKPCLYWPSYIPSLHRFVWSCHPSVLLSFLSRVAVLPRRSLLIILASLHCSNSHYHCRILWLCRSHACSCECFASSLHWFRCRLVVFRQLSVAFCHEISPVMSSAIIAWKAPGLERNVDVEMINASIVIRTFFSRACSGA